MGFTVNRRDGYTKDAEFEAYARLLRQQGVDLGRLPRAGSADRLPVVVRLGLAGEGASFRRRVEEAHA